MSYPNALPAHMPQNLYINSICLPLDNTTKQIFFTGHVEDREHTRQKCHETCLRYCAVGHKCPKICYQDCNPCLTRIPKVLVPCKHTQITECHRDPAKEYCLTKVVKVPHGKCFYVSKNIFGNRLLWIRRLLLANIPLNYTVANPFPKSNAQSCVACVLIASISATVSVTKEALMQKWHVINRVAVLYARRSIHARRNVLKNAGNVCSTLLRNCPVDTTYVIRNISSYAFSNALGSLGDN